MDVKQSRGAQAAGCTRDTKCIQKHKLHLRVTEDICRTKGTASAVYPGGHPVGTQAAMWVFTGLNTPLELSPQPPAHF